MTVDSGENWQKQGKHRLQRDKRKKVVEKPQKILAILTP
jgi:hypothetical protein